MNLGVEILPRAIRGGSEASAQLSDTRALRIVDLPILQPRRDAPEREGALRIFDEAHQSLTGAEFSRMLRRT